MNAEGTTERVLRLLGLLQRRPSWTATDLAAELTTRAVDRIGELTGHVVPSLAWPATDSPDASTVELADDVDASVRIQAQIDAITPTVCEFRIRLGIRNDGLDAHPTISK